LPSIIVFRDLLTPLLENLSELEKS